MPNNENLQAAAAAYRESQRKNKTGKRVIAELLRLYPDFYQRDQKFRIAEYNRLYEMMEKV